ncbi:MAG: glycosyltransferase family 39 protein [bacterium]|nr:glycosyltransferase family 39 protein [bacterium]
MKINSISAMKKWLFWLGLLVVIGLSIYLRFWNLETNPRWYNDECIYLNATRNLLHGKLQMQAVTWTFFSPHLPHPPLFFLLSAIALVLYSNGVIALRIIVALAGIATTILLYFTGKEIRDEQTGLWASFLFAIYPLSVIYTRWAFPYALGMFWILFTIYWLLRYVSIRKEKYLYFAGITAMLSVLTIYDALELILFLAAGMILMKIDWKKIGLILSIALGPLILLFLGMLMVDWQSVIYDLRMLVGRFVHESIPPHNFWLLVAGYKKLWLLDSFMFFGIIGLLFVKREYRLYLALAFLCISILPVARLGIYLDIFFHPIMICLPLIILGLANIVTGILEQCYRRLNYVIKKIPALSQFTIQFIQLAPIIIIFILLIPCVVTDIRSVNNVFIAKMNYFANRNNNHTVALAQYLNQHTEKNDVVIAPLCVQQFLQCNSTDLFQSAAYSGWDTQYYSAELPKERFKYPCAYYWVKYIVVSEVDRVDTITKPGVKELWQRIQADKWQIVYQLGEYDVYLNPLYKS